MSPMALAMISQTRKFDSMAGKLGAFPRVRRLLADPYPGKQSTTDILQFFESKCPIIYKDVEAGEVGPLLEPSRQATLLIVEKIDGPFIRILDGLCRALGLPLDLAFVEDFLMAQPWYNLGEVADIVPELQSAMERKGFDTFRYISAREFDGLFELKSPLLRPVRGTGREEQIAGSLNPIQVLIGNSGQPSVFPPALLIRKHLTAWFGPNTDDGWKIGVILVDPPFIPSASEDIKVLKPPLYRSFLPTPSHDIALDRSSYRATLTQYLSLDDKVTSSTGRLSPFQLLQGSYKLILAEWMVCLTYLRRDLQNTEWIMEGKGGGGETGDPYALERVLTKLFLLRRRLSRFAVLLHQHHGLCRRRARPSDADGDGADLAALEGDFGQLHGLVADNVGRVGEIITFVTSLMSILHAKTGVRESERAVEQNRSLMVLSVMATLFLPMNTVAAVLSMDGDFGPGRPRFVWFWAISLPLAASLMGVLAVARWWRVVV